MTQICLKTLKSFNETQQLAKIIICFSKKKLAYNDRDNNMRIVYVYVCMPLYTQYDVMFNVCKINPRGTYHQSTQLFLLKAVSFTA